MSMANLLPFFVQVVVERADTIISPNAVSGHVHTISGGDHASVRRVPPRS